MATTSKFDFGLINDQIKAQSDQIANLGEKLEVSYENLDYSSATGAQILCTLTISPGRWLLIGRVSINIADAVELNPEIIGLNVSNYSASNSAIKNGGWQNSLGYVDTSETITLSLKEYIYVQSNKYRCKLIAIRLK